MKDLPNPNAIIQAPFPKLLAKFDPRLVLRYMRRLGVSIGIGQMAPFRYGCYKLVEAINYTYQPWAKMQETLCNVIIKRAVAARNT